MTSDGILLNNAMANFAIPNDSGELDTLNQLAQGRRPLTSNVVALTMDTKDICGTRIVTGGSTASSGMWLMSSQKYGLFLKIMDNFPSIWVTYFLKLLFSKNTSIFPKK